MAALEDGAAPGDPSSLSRDGGSAARAAHIRSRLGSGPPAQCARNSFSA
jgi:hypothetical protein